MYYFVFDLDETLAQVHSVFYFLCDLRQKEIDQNSRDPPLVLRESLDTAYWNFVKLVAQQETSDTPLGILRPGILEVMNQLKRLKRLNIVLNVVIYSNNGSLACLNFVRDVIHTVIQDNTLICDTIHRYRKGREYERIGATKTWGVLSELLQTGPCRALSVYPSQVFFFDDLIHPNLKYHLGYQYIHVKPYSYKTSFDRLANLYLESLDKSGITSDYKVLDRFLKFTGTRCAGKISPTLSQHLQLYKTWTAANTSALPPPMDDSVKTMLEITQSLLPYAQNNINDPTTFRPNLLGGKKTHHKTQKRRRLLNRRKSRISNRK
jgi:hypothetical protein